MLTIVFSLTYSLDKSVSRVHATITVEPTAIHKLQGAAVPSKLYVQDQSKFGTFIRTVGADDSATKVKKDEKVPPL